MENVVVNNKGERIEAGEQKKPYYPNLAMPGIMENNSRSFSSSGIIVAEDVILPPEK